MDLVLFIDDLCRQAQPLLEQCGLTLCADIDTKVFFTSGRKHLPGDYVEVMIDGVEQYDLKGRALD